MRRPVLALLLLAVAAVPAGPVRAQDEGGPPLREGEWERDHPAVSSRAENVDWDDPDEPVTVRVVDGATGLPVSGALVRRYTEGSPIRAELLGAGRTDRHGFVVFAAHRWNSDCHWVAEAPGYAAAHDYGTLPHQDAMELQPAEDVEARFVDGLGRPLVGATVEAFLGCGHGPTVQEVVTDAEGIGRFTGLDPDEITLWTEAAGAAADYRHLRDGFLRGARGTEFRLSVGRRLAGVVLDAAGRPIHGARVRSVQCHRGPVTVTDRQGRFELRGLEEEAYLEIWHPLAETPVGIYGTEWLPEWELRVPITPFGPVWSEETDATLRVRVVSEADRAPAAGAGFHLVAPATGRAVSGSASDGDEDEEETGVAEMDVHAGEYVAVATFEPFSPWEVLPAPVLVQPGETGEITLTARRRPQLQVLGELPVTTNSLVLAVPGAEIELDLDEPTSALPADGPAVLRVALGDHHVEFHFPVGPMVDGVRTVEVAIPEPHRILPAPDGVEVTLWWQGGEADLCGVGDGVYATYAAGDLLLDVDGVSVPVSLPLVGAVVREVEIPDAETSLPRLRVRVVPPEGARDPDIVIDVEFDFAEDSYEHVAPGETLDVAFLGPARVRAGIDGFVTVSRRVTEPADVELRFGDARLDLTVLDSDGHPTEAQVLLGVDDYWAEDGTLSLRGLEPGPVEFLVLPSARWLLGKEVQLVLEPGTRTHTIRLTDR